MVIISRFNSKTDIPVPSKVILEGSFWDLNRKKTDEDMIVGVSEIGVTSKVPYVAYSVMQTLRK